ncbi:MAG: response regulator [Chloroflexota bacterium]
MDTEDAPAERKVIIIVEDNEDIASLLEAALNGEPDYQAVAVHDGSRALEVIHSVKASLILLDVMLPGIDGLQLYDMIRDVPETAKIPVIFVTATSHDEDFRKRGIDNHIVKPFDMNDLLARVAQICRPE